MPRRTIYLALLGGGAIALAIAVAPDRPPASAQTQTEETGCATPGDNPLIHVGDALDLVSLSREGVFFNPLSHNMTLMRTGGQHVEIDTGLGLTDSLVAGCAADFNRDGYEDVIGAGASGGVKIFLNLTLNVTAPDWTIANSVRAPLFAPGVPVDLNTTAKGLAWMACGDVDGDGFADAVLMRCSSSSTIPDGNCNAPDYHKIYYGNGIGGLRETQNLLNKTNQVGKLYELGTRMALHDVSGDGRNDLVMGLDSNGGGRVVAYIATLNLNKRFDNQIELFDDVGYVAEGGVTSLAVGDFTNDGKPDIVVGNGAESVVKLYTGSGGSAFASTGLPIVTNAYPVALVAGNFSLSGRRDLLVASSTAGQLLRLYENDGDNLPFSSGTVTTLHQHATSDVFRTALAIRYDGDPDAALDIMTLDEPVFHHLWSNRRAAGDFVDCGVMTSQNIPTDELDGEEAVITQIKITPTPLEPAAGSWTWQASNDGETWVDAIPCPDDASKHCVNFTTTSGANIQWRVTMCSSEDRAQAPVLNAVTTEFTYVAATNHFRAGPVAREGIIYVGAFREPGNDGRLFAIDDETQTVLWDGATKLDATPDGSRKIFAVDAGGTLRELTTANASSFVLSLVAADLTQAQDTISWLRSKRFGTNENNLHALGGIVNSTPALLSEPGLPYWFNLASTPSTEKTAIQAHVDLYEDREQLLLVGARDGMLHAFHTDPFDPADPTNGTEAWAFVPPSVLPRLIGDMTSNDSTAWPDGSPTLATAKVNGVFRSVLVMGEGNGGNSVFALDVTETVQTDGTVIGPTLLWTFTDSNMGLTSSKPVVIRTRINDTETWLAVFSSGKGALGDVGDSVYAVDISTGQLVWRFDIGDDNTYVSSDITAADEENAAPDGYISRLYFGDSKGRLWKLDPSTPVEGRVSAIGTVVIDEGETDTDPTSERALFSTRQTSGALGEDRGISGTLIAVPESNRLILYFGTGGTPETSTTAQNEFYAVFGDTGEIRLKMTPAPGVRFFGSATFNSGQIVFTRGEDVSSVDPCAPTSGEIVAIDAATFSEQFVIETNATLTAPMFAAGGEIFVLTLSGKVIASQYVGVRDTVSSGGGGGGGQGGGESIQEGLGEVPTPFVLLSWRQIY